MKRQLLILAMMLGAAALPALAGQTGTLMVDTGTLRVAWPTGGQFWSSNQTSIVHMAGTVGESNRINDLTNRVTLLEDSRTSNSVFQSSNAVLQAQLAALQTATDALNTATGLLQAQIDSWTSSAGTNEPLWTAASGGVVYASNAHWTNWTANEAALVALPAEILKTLTNYTHVPSATNWLDVDVANRGLRGCVTNVGGGSASAYTNLFGGAGTTGSVTSAAGDAGKYLKADGTWGNPPATGGTASAFADLTGDAYDNTSLSNALADKLTATAESLNAISNTSYAAATGTPLYVETGTGTLNAASLAPYISGAAASNVFQAAGSYATGTPVYAESDPAWQASRLADLNTTLALNGSRQMDWDAALKMNEGIITNARAYMFHGQPDTNVIIVTGTWDPIVYPNAPTGTYTIAGELNGWPRYENGSWKMEMDALGAWDLYESTPGFLGAFAHGPPIGVWVPVGGTGSLFATWGSYAEQEAIGFDIAGTPLTISGVHLRDGTVSSNALSALCWAAIADQAGGLSEGDVGAIATNVATGLGGYTDEDAGEVATNVVTAGGYQTAPQVGAIATNVHNALGGGGGAGVQAGTNMLVTQATTNFAAHVDMSKIAANLLLPGSNTLIETSGTNVKVHARSTTNFFSVYQSSAITQSVQSASNTVVDFNVADYGSAYNLADDYAILDQGPVMFSSMIQVGTLTDGKRIIFSLWKNGVEYKRGCRVLGGGVDTIGSAAAWLVYNDSATNRWHIRVNHNLGSATNVIQGAEWTYFTGANLP